MKLKQNKFYKKFRNNLPHHWRGMSKQDDFQDLMNLIHQHYSDEEISQYEAYSTMGVDDSPEVTITISTNSYGH